LTVNLPNDPALGLYRSLGFVECGREPDAVQLGGRYYHGTQMTLCKAESADAAYEYP
ncbi:MAG: Acetyltransferase domain, partial [Ramlibacter sp.]|nr:Acetyltransferase domain [Ramlibacter sp.]